MIKQTIPEFNDRSPFPFGKYKGYAFEEVPAEYFHWIWHNTNAVTADMIAIHAYIRDNINAFKRENPDLIWSKSL